MSETFKTKVLIIGSGPAGYTAAIYAARANLEPLQVLGREPGGQLTITTDVENYPGFADPIQGPWLMEQMKAQAEHVGTKTVHDMIVDIDLSKRPFIAKGESGNTYIGETVIISTGAKARWLGVTGEDEYRGFGASACATCDGFFYKNQHVAVIGGGNSAVEEALFLTNFASKVTLIHRRDELRAEKIAQDRLFAHEKVEVIWDSVVEEMVGTTNEHGVKSLTGLKLNNVKTNEKSTLDVDGVFIAIGHDPATELFKGKLDMDKEGYIIKAPDSTATKIAGVYAAGDVTDKVYRQAVTAAGMGCMAALEADRFLAEHGVSESSKAA
ncbi:MAG: thioredoxin-disulfide reductase [Micavibrio sp.]|nr:thioredoxin-disulfide reductase [Micavibrio sp.]|tara:strand:+ start:2233 stop:3210 length:978 start_codon:yes stop_codon:yes gene_type:complete